MTYHAVRHRYNAYKIKQRKEGYEAISGAKYTTPPEVQQKIDSTDHIVEPNKMVPASEIAVTAEDGKSKENEDVSDREPLLEATPEQPETPTIGDCLIVEDVEKVPLTRHDPKIPHSEDGLIFDMRESGKTYREIVEALAKKGIVCAIGDVAPRYQTISRHRAQANAQPKPQNVAPAQPTTTTSPSLPGVEGAQEVARANPRGQPEENTEPKIISRHELASKTWDMHKAGKTPEQISDALCEQGYYYGKERVRRMLIQQGADL
jgi:hypothetical protein